VDFKAGRNNLFVVAISIGFGMIPLVAPTLLKKLPETLHPLLDSGILLASIAAVLLNAFLNGLGSAEASAADLAQAATASDHA
jgi:uric acid transporter